MEPEKSKTEQDFKNFIKYLKGYSEEQLIKSLDYLLLQKIITKTNYKILLEECKPKDIKSDNQPINYSDGNGY